MCWCECASVCIIARYRCRYHWNLCSVVRLMIIKTEPNTVYWKKKYKRFGSSNSILAFNNKLNFKGSCTFRTKWTDRMPYCYRYPGKKYGLVNKAIYQCRGIRWNKIEGELSIVYFVRVLLKLNSCAVMFSQPFCLCHLSIFLRFPFLLPFIYHFSVLAYEHCLTYNYARWICARVISIAAYKSSLT